MKFKLLISVIFFAFLYIFPPTVYANNIYFISVDNQGNFYWDTEKVKVKSKNPEEIAFTIFENYFKTKNSNNVAVLDTNIIKGVLHLNVSKEISNYGGATNEINLVNSLVRTAVEIKGIEELTLLIEGEEGYLPEGSIIKNESNWERTP